MKMHNLNPSDFILDEIESIELIGDMDTVDITVEDTHMFYANDVYSHNSGLDVSIVTLQAISEALSKAMVADLIISIGRSPELQKQGRACYYLAKNRLGVDKIAFTGEFDTSIMNFTIDTEGMEEELNRNDNQGAMNRAVDSVLKKDGGRTSEVLRELVKKLGSDDE